MSLLPSNTRVSSPRDVAVSDHSRLEKRFPSSKTTRDSVDLTGFFADLEPDEATLLALLDQMHHGFRRGKKNYATGPVFYVLQTHYGWSQTQCESVCKTLCERSILKACDGGIRFLYTVKGFKIEFRSSNLADQNRSDEELFRVWKQCAYCCRTLTRSNRTKDHVVPRSHGGGDELTNLVGCCTYCNAVKGSRTPIEWARDILDYRNVPKKKPKRRRPRFSWLRLLVVMITCLLPRRGFS